jgi:6,7-dimethyl-8-ribityllumazine synthase
MADIANSNLFKSIDGIRNVKNTVVVLVKTEWNAAIVDELENKCLEVLHQYNIKTHTIVVPGAVEIPFAINQYYTAQNKKHKPAAFIALGCVIKGDTPHFDYVCQSVTYGITQLNVQLSVPSILGVLTVNSLQQAHDRIGGQHGHKGEEAAITAIKMIILKKSFSKD